MKKLTLTLAWILFAIASFGQTSEVFLQVISTAGGYDEIDGSDLFVSWTLGEPVIETFINSDAGIMLTQGFQQGDVASYSLTLLANPDDIGAELTGAGDYDVGTQFNITASQIEGYTFIGWSGAVDDVTLLDDPTETISGFTMPTRNVTLTANYQLTEYTLTVNIYPEGAGSVTGAGNYAMGDSITLTATPEAGYEFLNWRKGGSVVNSENPYKFAMPNEDVTLTAYFVEAGTETYSLTLVADPDDIGALLTGTGDYEENETVTISASVVEGYLFIGWTGSTEDVDLLDDSTAMEASFDMPARDITLTATYEMLPPDMFTLTLLADPSDIGAVLTGDGEYAENDSVSISAAEVVGYSFIGWAGNAEDLDLLDDSTAMETYFHMPARDITLTASYQLTDYTIAVNVYPENAGTITGAGTYNMGDVITLTATAEDGYEFLNWRLEGSVYSSDNPLEFDMPAIDLVFTAYFIAEGTETYTLTLLADPDDIGAILIGSGEYEEAEIITIAASLVEGYNFAGWTGDADDLELLEDPSANTTTIEIPNRNVTLTATYQGDTPPLYTVTFTVTDADDAAIEGAQITIDYIDGFLTTDASGIATIDLENGSYSFTVTATDFEDYTDDFVVAGEDISVTASMVAVGVESYLLSNLEVYPNPFRSNITLNNAVNVSRVTITNLIGQKIAEIQVTGSERLTIQTRGLVNGIYLIIFHAENGERVIKKMVKE